MSCHWLSIGRSIEILATNPSAAEMARKFVVQEVVRVLPPKSASSL